MSRDINFGIILAVFLSLIFTVGCMSLYTLKNEGSQIVIKVTFPEQQKRIIPAETTYFEIAIQREGASTWIVKTFAIENGTEQTATFTVVPGTYRIDACAKTYSGEGPERPNQFLALGTTSITLNPGETKKATITLCPILYDFTETATQATSTAPVVLSFKMKVPTPFVEDFAGHGLYTWVKGELAEELSELVFFHESIVGSETIEVPLAGSVEYTTIQYTSDEFSAPSVTATTTYTWYFYLYALTANKWRIHVHNSPVQSLTVFPGSGIVIGLQ